MIDKGRLVVHAPLGELTARPMAAVIVRTADPRRLRDGLAAHGFAAEIIAGDQVSTAGATPEDVGRAIAAAGVVVYEMHVERPNLEDVYFELTEGSRR
jgi:ABC-2 type transport system ATP-binding protein